MSSRSAGTNMPTIQLRTYSGPESTELMRRRERLVPRGVFTRRLSSPRAPKAPCSKMWTATAFSISRAASACSTSAPRAARRRRVARTDSTPSSHLLQRRALRKIYRLGGEAEFTHCLASSRRRRILVNSGAEAIENAVKIARAYTSVPRSSASKTRFTAGR